MGLREILFGRAAPAESSAPPSWAPAVVAPYLDHTTAMGVSSVWRAVHILADTIADLPWTEWRGAEQLEPSRLVRRPMATMTRREWTWRVVAGEALSNTVYLLHVGGSDTESVPWSLLPCVPGMVTPLGPIDPWGLTQPAEYQVGSQRVSAEYVTVLRRSPFPGVSESLASVLSIARAQFQAYLAADTAMSRYWTAGGPTTTVITTDQELSDPEAAAIAERWRARRTKGADYPAVLGKGAEARPWGADPSAESSVEARREMNADVARYFGIPTRLINAPAGDTQTYANVEQEAVDLERYSLRGYIGPIEDVISELLPGDYMGGRRMVLDTTRLTQGDLESRSRAWPALVTAGIATPEEARAKGFGLPPKPLAGELRKPAPAPEPAMPADSTPADHTAGSSVGGS